MLASTLFALAVAPFHFHAQPTPAPAPAPVATPAPEPIRTLLITGANNHNWKYTSRFHAETLEATGRFKVEIADNARAALNDPNGLDHVQLFVLDYNGPRWGETAEANYMHAVKEHGAGVVIIHANPLLRHPETLRALFAEGVPKSVESELYRALILLRAGDAEAARQALSAADQRAAGKPLPPATDALRKGLERVLATNE